MAGDAPEDFPMPPDADLEGATWSSRRMKDWLRKGRNAHGSSASAPVPVKEVVRAFRRLSLRLHPDKQGGRSPNEQVAAAEEYLAISQAAGGWSDTEEEESSDADFN
ncbi:unnamed protein product, partial [Symbiodinium sp. CCMP2456]